MTPMTPFSIQDAPLTGVHLIEASAGTGKTWNICGLYLRMLLERKLEVHRILVLTFTKAATAELRTRIRARLVDTLRHLSDSPPQAADPFITPLLERLLQKRENTLESLRLRTETALLNFDEAAIFTIHGFCQRALADTAFAAGQAFSQEMTPDDRDLRLEVVHDFWRTQIAHAAMPPELARYLLAKNFSPATLDALLKRRLEKPLATCLWPENLPLSMDTQSLRSAYEKAQTAWHAHREDIIALVKTPRLLNGKTYNPSAVQNAIAHYDAWLNADAALIEKRDEKKLPLLTTSVIQEKTNKGKTPPQHLFFDLAQDLLAACEQLEAALEGARLQWLRHFLYTAPDTIRQRKRERRRQSFDDLLFNLHHVLHSGASPWMAELLRQRFPAALVDEFQDTDPLQFAIFETLYDGKDNTLYMVGDPKQAIYRFRNADLQTYLRARAHAKNTFTLSHNQRSSDALIQAVNHVFEANPQAFILNDLHFLAAGIGEKRPAAFIDRTDALDAPLRLWQLPDTSEGHLARSDARARAIAATAGEIARLLTAAQAAAIQIDGRALQAGDMAVLVRSHRQAVLIKQALGALHVASVISSRVSVFATADAEEIERLLCAACSPTRLPLLRSALATELLGLDAKAIAALADDETIQPYLSRFSEYRRLWLRHGIGLTLRQMIHNEGISARLLARPDGERRLTNVLHLTELLHQASEQHPQPDALLRWLQTQRRETSEEDAFLLRLETDRNLVQILTIHQSKGLEFPIVFCPFLWDGHRQRDSRTDGLEYHNDEGATFIDFRPEARDDAGIADAIRQEADAEEMRLIYVALTRAIYRCYAVAGCYLTQRNSTRTSQSHAELFNWLAAGQTLSPQAWRNQDRKQILADDIESAWSQLAASSRGHIALLPLPADQAAALPLETSASASLVCQATPSHMPSGWRIGSFSGLTRGTQHETAASDHDASIAVSPPDHSPSVAAPEENDILHFPKGSQAGLCIHKLFELSDFTCDDQAHAAIKRALSAYPQDKGLNETSLSQMLAGLFDHVVQTPLPDGIVLKRLPTTKRLNELGFYLPPATVPPNVLAQRMKALGYVIPALHYSDMGYYLKGFIDLVFEHEGRFYILDWKSNHLGHRPQDYDSEAVRKAMDENGYHLQYLLYTIALNRYLASRLPDYDYRQHFGGVLYLFVRGVRPDWRNADGSPCGVFFERPAPDVIDELDQCFSVSRRKVA